MADIKVEGADKIVSSLGDFRKGMPGGVKTALAGCSDFLVGKAKPLVPAVSGAARRSLMSVLMNGMQEVVAGGRLAAYYGWLDFGGRTGKHKSVSRRFIAEGRYLFPTARKQNDQFTKIAEAALHDVAKGAGLKVT